MTSSNTAVTTLPATAIDIGTLVRKASAQEVLITAWTRLCETTQQITVHWPRDHAFYAEGHRYSPLLLTESLRQALALLTHEVHEVPLGHRLGWEQLRFRVDPAALTIDRGPGSESVTLLVSHPSVRRRRMGSFHLTSHIEAFRLGERIGHAEVQYSAHPPLLYDRLRGPYANAAEAFSKALPPAPPVAAHLVGRGDGQDVVLSPTGTPLTWQLRTDTGHPVLFDHPHDHVPGMVLLEAAVQAAQAALPEPVDATACDTEFFRYVEFDRPCLVTAEPGVADGTGRRQVLVHASQDGIPTVTTAVTTTPRSA
ncbi:ScbA/BarX family gamma-butyrolactone biosynthesis protein [Streptomyces sp. NPDC020807]|uniref:ScbA/BarX family gamma-butyrolactone biosynthesis protein n=1 Tax=Streptomyces sp. NPDC020807 TaxID=3155119 RepID=UPI0033E42951